MTEKYVQDECIIYLPNKKIWTRNEIEKCKAEKHNPILVVDELFDFRNFEGEVMAVKKNALKLGEQVYDFLAGEWVEDAPGFYGVPVMTVDLGTTTPAIFKLIEETYESMGIDRFFIRMPGAKGCLSVDIEPERKRPHIGNHRVKKLDELSKWGEAGELDKELSRLMSMVGY